VPAAPSPKPAPSTDCATTNLMQRRHLLANLIGALAPTLAEANASESLVTEDLTLPAAGKFVCRARLLRDPHTPPQRLLILLHGRGEADSSHLALKAWSHLYGLLESYARLQTPPLVPLLKQPTWESARAAQMNTELSSNPFRGFAIVCPVTPNPARHGNRAALYRDYAEWLITELVPSIRQRAPSLSDRIGLDGCSMGGSLALELFLERPDFFHSFGAVQAAIGTDRVEAFAERFAAAGRNHPIPRVHLLTSTGDPYRLANERLSEHLKAVNVDASLNVIHGPHNQQWLRQMGTLAMLFWHDRAL
jgi:predicted esterase